MNQSKGIWASYRLGGVYNDFSDSSNEPNPPSKLVSEKLSSNHPIVVVAVVVTKESQPEKKEKSPEPGFCQESKKSTTPSSLKTKVYYQSKVKKRYQSITNVCMFG